MAAVETRDAERDLIEAARGGDRDAFSALVAPYRPPLQAHYYTLLASVHDAEDALQEAMLRAWVGLAQWEGRGSIRSWLYTIATRAALDAAAQRQKRVARIARPGADFDLVDPFPDEQLGEEAGRPTPEAVYELRESVELAFVAAVQLLPPRQRAVLLLREVLGFSAQEVADALDTTVAAANSNLQRARALLRERCPDPSQAATLRSVGDARVRDLVARYAAALEQADAGALLDLLVEDASWSMPPSPDSYRGHKEIAEFLAEGPFRDRWRHLVTRANGQLAVAGYVWDPARRSYVAGALDVLTLRGARIASVTAYLESLESDVFPRFGLPSELAERADEG
jgi:RNA polymerase sigma-70 factor (ECF subfamily)